MARYVVTFDTPDAGVLESEAPELLAGYGFSTDTYFPRLGIGVVDGERDQLASLRARCGELRRPMTFTQELTYHAISGGEASVRPGAPPFSDTADLTWGLQAVGIDAARAAGQSGAGVRVAVLDTGLDRHHPDFSARAVVTQSFVPGEGPYDAHGHGTHCAGTACGPWAPSSGPGYGVAPEAELYAGKVLGDEGSGSDTTILAGIDWALQNECHIISMSLGADVREVHPPYVAAGRRALEQGALVIAAAGNNAQRSAGDPGFVGAPANSPYVLAVAAVGPDLRTADFSARSSPHDGGEVNVAAPGVEVHSAWPEPERYRSISGTSMAAPHVAGLAALICGATGVRGQDLWDRLLDHVAALPQEDPLDVGAGLAKAPETPSW
ncbi:S8 family serine peptidase [Nesterenkonia sphaerica]|uniref:Peptidase S8 n=1 Tax=Nesterenkonia sphaerica TaxID=1804988 RepID=A0A5R9ADI6_9MICC|nr:S8 family serine peptidase [Nesterenkonia sphaerica]TLP76849.1 peptidase S8 [Nesterenkonia sphaerica]